MIGSPIVSLRHSDTAFILSEMDRIANYLVEEGASRKDTERKLEEAIRNLQRHLDDEADALKDIGNRMAHDSAESSKSVHTLINTIMEFQSSVNCERQTT